MKTYDAQKVDLTGCTLDQVLYVINRGCPVIALTSADHAILLTGYTKNDITYIDPENGESQTVSISEMEGMVSILEVGSEQLLEYGIKTTGSSIVQMKILSFLGYIRKIYKAFLKIIPRYLLSAP